jgi:hypothetical protein
MVYLQINGEFRTHIFNFGRPNRYCQHIYIDFHTCSQKSRAGQTGSGWFIYKSTGSFERTYSILADPTGTVNISTSISTRALRRLGQDSLATNQRWLSNAHIRFWPTQPVLSTYLHRFPHVFSDDWFGMVYLQINSEFWTHIFNFDRPNRYCQHIYIDFHTCSQKTRSGWFIYKSTGSFERTYSILTDPTGTVNISTSISTHALRRLGQDGLSTNQRGVSNAHIRFWPTQPVLSTYLHRFPHVLSED